MIHRPTNGPLVVHPANPRYFGDASGDPVYLTGSHTWATLQERGVEGVTHDFDYGAYLDFMVANGHSFLRMWTWEHATWMQFTDRRVRYKPHPYPRTGPGEALDGEPRFDVSRWDQAFFDRLRERVIAARERGIYVSVMLFQGFSVAQKGTVGAINPEIGNQWAGHPFNRHNNVNGLDGDPDGDGRGYEIHTMSDVPQIVAIRERQVAYVRKMVETVNDLDNVLWEISNESHGGSSAWQHYMIRLVKEIEAEMPVQHPVGMTYPWDKQDPGSNADLLDSPADWVSLHQEDGQDYRHDPPAADGHKVSLPDSDHIAPEDTEHDWVWKCFVRGHNPIFMDYYRDTRIYGRYETSKDVTRRAMGATRAYAERMDLAAVAPHDDLSSTRYCLANPGVTYLAYQPDAGSAFTVALAPGAYDYEWFECLENRIAGRGRLDVDGGPVSFVAPFAGDAVVFLERRADR